MLVSPAKALEMYQVSKPTLYADMKSGKISFTKDDRGKRKLEIAELDRVYVQREVLSKPATNQNITRMGQTDPQATEYEKKLLEQQIKFLELQVKTKDEMIEQWQSAFEKAQKTADKITALLEDRSAGQKGRGEELAKIDYLEQAIKKLTEAEDRRLKEEEKKKQKREQMNSEAKKKQEAEAAAKSSWLKQLFK